jgi:hypothetical protein
MLLPLRRHVVTQTTTQSTAIRLSIFNCNGKVVAYTSPFGWGVGGGEEGGAVNSHADSCVILTHDLLNIRQTQHLLKT